MLKFGRKMKDDKAGERSYTNEFANNHNQHGITEDRISPMTPPYLLPGAISGTGNVSGPEGKAALHPTSARRQSSSKKTLPPLFLYIEAGDFQKAMERAQRHPREVRTWASIKIKPSQPDTTKRLALHQACFKVS